MTLPNLHSSTFKASILLSCFFFPLFCFMASAAEIHVYPGGSIQNAINAAVDADEVIVHQGTYVENISFGGKNIILRSTDPTSSTIVSSTIIDGNTTGSVVTFSGTELASCVLSGFTITNGSAANGAGIFGNHTLATIQHNQITANSVSAAYPQGNGGGLYMCDGTIQYNTIASNSASHDASGGGLFACNGTIQHNIITGNFAEHGGGLYGCDGTIQHNTVTGNSADIGAGLSACNGTIQHNTFSENSAEYGGAIGGCSSGGSILDNTITSNSAIYNGGGLHSCHTTIQNNTIASNLASNGGGLAWCENASIQSNTISNNSARAGGGLYQCGGSVSGNTISGNLAETNGGGLSSCGGVENNTITANTALNNGGGIHACSGVMDNIVEGNWAGQHGGGLSACFADIKGNSISHNVATGAYSCGGGLYGCREFIACNIIAHNTASYAGGGLHSCDNSAIQNNIIFGNISEYRGGGLYDCDQSRIQHNTIWGNAAAHRGGGLGLCNGTIRNCIIWQNSAPSLAQLDTCSSPSYSCIQDWTDDGTGNLSVDPLLVDPDNGDFHLTSASLCIDAGELPEGLMEDFEGDPRPCDAVAWETRGDGSDFDIGADEFIGTVPFLTPTLILDFDFDTGPQAWSFRQLPPSELHVSHWDHATSVITASAVGISTPYGESTNYFALWDSLDAEPIPYLSESLYRVDWLFSTNRQTTNAVPSFRFRVGLSTQKAFALARLYPGDWLPLATSPGTTRFLLLFEPPIPAEGLFLAFSLIDWTDDFRGSMPAGQVYLEEVSVYRYDLSSFTIWTPESITFDPTSWSQVAAPPYDAPTFTQTASALSLQSGTNASFTFGSWDSPSDLFSLEPSKVYRLTSNVSASPQLGGPDLRLRVHTDDYRYAWYTYYVSSYTPGESALPPEAGADCRLYLTQPFAIQPCHLSFDLIDFSSTSGGTLTLNSLDLHSHPF